MVDEIDRYLAGLHLEGGVTPEQAATLAWMGECCDEEWSMLDYIQGQDA